MGASIRLLAAALLLACTGGCMHQRFEREFRRPWSRSTTAVEDAIWTVEEIGRVTGGFAVAVLTLGLIDPLETEDHEGVVVGWPGDDEDEDDDRGGDGARRRAPGAVQTREPGHIGRAERRAGGGSRRRAVGRRRDR